MPSPPQFTYTFTNATRTHIHHELPSSFTFCQNLCHRVAIKTNMKQFLPFVFHLQHVISWQEQQQKETSNSTHHAFNMRTWTIYLLLFFISICITFPITGQLFLVTWWINHMRRNNSQTFGARCDQLPPVVSAQRLQSFIAIALNQLDERNFEFVFVSFTKLKCIDIKISLIVYLFG